MITREFVQSIVNKYKLQIVPIASESSATSHVEIHYDVLADHYIVVVDKSPNDVVVTRIKAEYGIAPAYSVKSGHEIAYIGDDIDSALYIYNKGRDEE